MAEKKVNWEIVKAEYVSNSAITLPILAKKHNISLYYLQQVSAREGWVKIKKDILKKATEGALEEVEGSLKDLIVRHAKVARFLQSAGITRLQKRIKELGLLDENPKLAKQIRRMDDRVLVALVAEGLKAERELYPKQLQVQSDVTVEASGISDTLDKAIYEAFRRGLGRKRPSIHDGKRKTSRSKKSNKA
jgi:hypothetical protein